MVSPKSGYTASLNAGSKVKFVVFFIYNSEFFESLICDIKSSVEKTVLIEGMLEDGMYSSTESMSLQLIEAMNKTLLNNLEGIEQRLFLEGQFSTILSLLLLDKKPGNAEKSFTTEEAKLINLVRTTLDQEFINSPTIKELAKKVGTNTNKLYRLFRGDFDTTINKYVLNKKWKWGVVFYWTRILPLQKYQIRSGSSTLPISVSSSNYIITYFPANTRRIMVEFTNYRIYIHFGHIEIDKT